MDSLLRAMKEEPSRFLRYLNFKRIRSPEDFIREFTRAFDSNFGQNALASMTKEHWNFLLKTDIVQEHFQKINQIEQLQDQMKKDEHMKMIKKALKEHDDEVKKTIVVKDAQGRVLYTRSNQKWDERQEKFLERHKDGSPSKVTELYNKMFDVHRTVASIASKLRRMFGGK